MNGTDMDKNTTLDDAPVMHGKYTGNVSYQDGLLVLTLSHVERRWMPFRLFGRTVLSKILNIKPSTAVQVGQLLTLSNDNVQGVHMDGQVLLNLQWPVELRNQVHGKILKELHGGSESFSLRVQGVGAWIVTVIGLYLILSMLTAQTAGKNFTAPAAAAPIAHDTQAFQDTDQAQMSSASLAQRAIEQGAGNTIPVSQAIASASKVVLRAAPSGGKTILIWSDALCPHCRDLEENVVSKLPKEIGVTIIPVSFKEGSRPLASYVVCGTDEADKAVRWTGLMSPTPNAHIERQCKDGPGIVDANTVLFARAGLTSTPSIMTQSGDRVFDGDPTSLTTVVAWASK